MFLQKTWDWVSEAIDLRDFSPKNQDLAAVFLLIDCGAIPHILRNDIQGAIGKASRFWAPMPGNNYNQPQTKISELLTIYNKRISFYRSLKKQSSCKQYSQKKGTV